MGGSNTKEDKEGGDTSENIQQNHEIYSGGLHILEIHASTLAGGSILTLVLLTMAALGYFLIKRRNKSRRYKSQVMHLLNTNNPPTFPGEFEMRAAAMFRNSTAPSLTLLPPPNLPTQLPPFMPPNPYNSFKPDFSSNPLAPAVPPARILYSSPATEVKHKDVLPLPEPGHAVSHTYDRPCHPTLHHTPLPALGATAAEALFHPKFKEMQKVGWSLLVCQFVGGLLVSLSVGCQCALDTLSLPLSYSPCQATREPDYSQQNMNQDKLVDSKLAIYNYMKNKIIG